MQTVGSIAVVLATCNSERYILPLLKSLARQTLKDFTIYVGDDFSIDNTLEIVTAFLTKNNMSFVIMPTHAKCVGAAENFKNIIKQVEEDYIFFCDHDDVWEPKKIEVMTSIASQCKKECFGLAYCDYNYISDKGYALNLPKIGDMTLNNIEFENTVPGCTMMISQSLKNHLSNYSDIDLMHDWMCLIIAKKEDLRIININEALHRYRIHENNLVGVRRSKIFCNPFTLVKSFYTNTVLTHDSIVKFGLRRPGFVSRFCYLVQRFLWKLGN